MADLVSIGGEGITASKVQSGSLIYAPDTGLADAYVVTLTPVPNFTGVIGMEYTTTITHANLTTTPTMNLNGQGVQNIKRPDGSSVAVGDLPLNWKAKFSYNGATHYLMNPATWPTSALTGTIGTAQIANGAVGSSQIANGAVGATQIANGGVGTAQIANGAVDSTKASSLFGAWDNTKAVNTVYGPAATDLIILASASSIGLGAAYLYVKSDASNPPTSIVGQANITGLANGPLNPPGFCKKGHYWKAEISGASAQGLWVIPQGS